MPSDAQARVRHLFRLVTARAPDEVEMITVRAEQLLRRGRFPIDRTGRHYPWPLV